jgi:CRP-like cAMP-binding protein
MSDDGARHIGCPLAWFRLVFSVVHGKNELAVALYLYRLRMVRRSRTVAVSNVRLLAELGVDRFAKYRALGRLADAGIITIRRRHKRALEIRFVR